MSASQGSRAFSSISQSEDFSRCVPIGPQLVKPLEGSITQLEVAEKIAVYEKAVEEAKKAAKVAKSAKKAIKKAKEELKQIRIQYSCKHPGDFFFITELECNIEMFSKAYQSVTKLGLWEWFKTHDIHHTHSLSDYPPEILSFLSDSGVGNTTYTCITSIDAMKKIATFGWEYFVLHYNL